MNISGLSWLAAAAALMAASCSDACYENKNTLPEAGFYSSSSDPQPVTLDSIEVVGVGMKNDSVLSSGSMSKSMVYLPFRIDSDTTSYAFIDVRQKSLLRDTISFVYTRTPRFVSAECGVSYVFDIKSISSQGILIDSVVCPQGFIDNVNTENIKIYFAVSPENE